MEQISSEVKTKLGIHDLLDLEIDTGYKKTRFQTLYKITGLLGVGAFGVVIAAINNMDQQEVAVKVVS